MTTNCFFSELSCLVLPCLLLSQITTLPVSTRGRGTKSQYPFFAPASQTSTVTSLIAQKRPLQACPAPSTNDHRRKVSLVLPARKPLPASLALRQAGRCSQECFAGVFASTCRIVPYYYHNYDAWCSGGECQCRRVCWCLGFGLGSVRSGCLIRVSLVLEMLRGPVRAGVCAGPWPLLFRFDRASALACPSFVPPSFYCVEP